MSKVALAVFLSLTLSFGLSEISVRAYTSFHLIYDVEMTRYGHEMTLPSSNPNIGHIQRPNANGAIMGVELRTNTAGFRDDEYPLAKGGRQRIIFLGDSVLLGWGVKREETFKNLLEKELNRERPTEILNFGTANFNTVQEVSLLAERGLAYRPDQVVVFFAINDPEPTPKDSPWKFLGNSRFLTLLWSRLKELGGHEDYRSYYTSLYSDSAEGWVAMKSAFRELKRLGIERHFKFQVVLIPDFHMLNPYPFSKEYQKVAEVLTKEGIPFLDLSSKFSAVAQPESLWVAPDDTHPNPTAHQMIAAFARDFISHDP